MIGLKLKVREGEVRATVRSGAKKGAVKAMEAVLADSRQRVPVKTGRLRDSGHVRAGDSGAEVRYSCPYAVYVHEMDMHHEHGEKKFLENALEEELQKGTLMESMREAVRRELS